MFASKEGGLLSKRSDVVRNSGMYSEAEGIEAVLPVHVIYSKHELLE